MVTVRLVVLLLILGAPTQRAFAACDPAAAASSFPSFALAAAIRDAYKKQTSGPNLPDPKVIDTRYDVGRLRNLFQHLDLPKFPSQFRVYAVVSNRYQRSYREEILIPVDALICLLRPMTAILISDGITNHYVTIDHIDEPSSTAYIVDGWPKESFLVSQELAENERGRLENIDLGITIALPLRTLSQYLIGAMLIDTDGFREQVRLVDSDLEKEPGNLIALGSSRLREDQRDSYPNSIELFRKAAEAARITGDGNFENGAKQELSYALAMSVMRGAVAGEQANSYLQEYNKMENEGFGFNSYAVDRLLSVGDVFLRSRNAKMANQLATQAITSSPDDERGYIFRASTLTSTGDDDAALLDAEHAYRLNTALIRHVILVQADDFLDKFFDQYGDVSIYRELSDRRAALLFLVGTNLVPIGKHILKEAFF
jgi:hypothetical protein